MTLYNKMRQTLMQNGTAILLQNPSEFFYKMWQVSYYKMRRFYYKMRQLLQNMTFITKCVGTRSINSFFFCINILYKSFLKMALCLSLLERILVMEVLIWSRASLFLGNNLDLLVNHKLAKTYTNLIREFQLYD